MRRRFSSMAKVSGLDPVIELADHLELGDIDDVDHVVVAAGDVELGMIGIEMHVARPPRRPDVLDDLVGLGIDDDEVVGLLVADEDQAGVLGRCAGAGASASNGGETADHGQEQASEGHGRFSSLACGDRVAASVRLIEAAGQAGSRMAPLSLRDINLPASREGTLADGRTLSARAGSAGACAAAGQRRQDLWAGPGRRWRELSGRARGRVHRAARPQRRRQVDPVPAAVRAVRAGFRPHRGDGPRHDARSGAGAGRGSASCSSSRPSTSNCR